MGVRVLEIEGDIIDVERSRDREIVRDRKARGITQQREIDRSIKTIGLKN